MSKICLKNVSIPVNKTSFTHVIFLMGCTPSSQTKREKIIGNDTNLMEAYQKIESEIWHEEQQSPASALTHVFGKLEKITTDLEKISADVTQSQNLNGIFNVNLENLEDLDDSVKSVMTELRVTNNPKFASEHEEFIANLNRKALKCRQIYLLNNRKMEIEEEAMKLSESVQNLQKLYEQQETILSEIFGSSYMSKSQSELDRLRNYRDTLYSGKLAWQDAIKLTQSASVFAQVGHNSWVTINPTASEDTRFKLATETRNSVYEAVLLIEAAQSLLTSVQFPYCTQREIHAVLQVIKYLYTDMQIPERYEYAKEVYKSFHKRSTALAKWLKDMMDSTIQNDIQEVDAKIEEHVSKVKSERMLEIRKKISNVGLVNGMIASNFLENVDTQQPPMFLKRLPHDM